MDRFFLLNKQASLTGLDHIYQTPPAEIATPAAKTPKTPTSNDLKLTNGLGKKRPLHVAKKPTSSPYNPN